MPEGSPGWEVRIGSEGVSFGNPADMDLGVRGLMRQEIVPNEALGPRFHDALVYAAEVHADQSRKGSDTPYVSHLLAVAGLVIEDGAAAGQLSEDEVIAALLHDAPEDQGGEERLADIRDRFGERVAEIVAACSDTFETPKPPWRERKQAYLDHLSAETDTGVLRVSLADKVHNARAVLADYREIGDALWSRFNREADTPWYYRNLVRIFSERAPGPLADELARRVGELELLIDGDHARADPASERGAGGRNDGR